MESKAVKIEKVKADKPLARRRLRENMSVEFSDVIKTLKIDEFFTKADNKQKYNKFVLNVVPEADFNFMADLIELPTTKEKYKWLLVVLDLATNEFDIEPMKNKESGTTMIAFKTMMKRKFLNYPEISLKTDGGTEFKGKFHEHMIDKGIFHKTAMPYRKSQLGPVEGLNRTLVRLLMNYTNSMSVELKEEYNEWTDLLDAVRVELNKYRVRDLEKLDQYQGQYRFDSKVMGEPEYKIGDFVHWKLNRPTDILGKTINDGEFREGDRRFSIEVREIVDILPFLDEPYYRFKLKEMPNVSYSANELKLSKEKVNLYSVKKIIGKKQEKKVKYYLVHWKGKLKKNATWERAQDLIEDGLEDEIKAYEKSLRIKASARAKARKQ
jgi:hypothetical protein